MATLETHQISFEPDMNIIREQCNQVLQRNPSLKSRISTAIKNFEKAKKYVDHGNVGKALEKLGETARYIMDAGVDELDACCFFYMGFLALGAGGDEPEMVKTGIDMLNGALNRTRDPWLALTTYNRLMIHYLTNENLDEVIKLAVTTKKVVSNLPRSTPSMYFSAAASYSIAEARYRQGQYSEVFSSIQEALQGFGELSMKAETAKCQGLLGNSLILSGKVKEGIENTEKSLKLFRELKDDGEIAFLLLGRALAMAQMGNKTQAVKDLHEALILFRRRGEVNAINSTLAVLSELEAQ